MPLITTDFSKISRFNKSADEISFFREKMREIEEFPSKPMSKKRCLVLYYSMLALLENLPLLALPLDEDLILLRARANDGTRIFSCQHEISYNTKNVEKILTGRFNLQKEGMFYAAIQSEKQQELWLITAALECYKDLVNSEVTDSSQIFTFGVWQVVARMVLINLCFDEDALQGNVPLKEIIKRDLNNTKQSLYTSSFNLINNFWNLLSRLASKPNPNQEDYAVTTCFRTVMKRIYLTEFVGIIYPSSVTGKKGLNVVLFPDAVDSNLILKQVVMYKCDRDLGLARITGEAFSDVVEVINKRFYFL